MRSGVATRRRMSSPCDEASESILEVGSVSRRLDAALALLYGNGGAAWPGHLAPRDDVDVNGSVDVLEHAENRDAPRRTRRRTRGAVNPVVLRDRLRICRQMRAIGSLRVLRQKHQRREP